MKSKYLLLNTPPSHHHLGNKKGSSTNSPFTVVITKSNFHQSLPKKSFQWANDCSSYLIKNRFHLTKVLKKANQICCLYDEQSLEEPVHAKHFFGLCW